MFCLIHRWKIDRALDDNQALPAPTQAHLTHCLSCREHHQQQVQLITRLKQPTTTPEAPTYLRARILNALQSAETEVSPEPAQSHIQPVWAPIAACAVIAYFLYPHSTPLPSPPVPPVAATEQPALPSVELPEINLAKALETAHDTVANPYDQELKNLQNDLQAAGQYFGRLMPIRVAIND